MKEIKLINNKKMIEIDVTFFISDFLSDYLNGEVSGEEKFNQEVTITSYYLKDNINHWEETPLFTIVSFKDTYEIVNHDSGFDLDVFNDIYNCLTKNDLLEYHER